MAEQATSQTCKKAQQQSKFHTKVSRNSFKFTFFSLWISLAVEKFNIVNYGTAKGIG